MRDCGRPSPTARADSGTEQCGDTALLRALAAPETYQGCPDVTVHETHASWVFVAGARAFKVKKPVKLDFLDYSTLGRRRSACREEVRINRELAPGLYLGVRAIVRGPTGFRLVSGDAPDAVEYAVEMKSFREEDTFAGLIAAGSLKRGDVVAAARRLARFHRAAPVVGDWGPDRVLAVWSTNVRELQRVGHPAEWRLDELATFGEAFVSAYAPELRRRVLEGLARDGHGDLRCEHVLARPAIRVVDRVEFDPALRRTDVACDLAFLAMDLEANGQRWAVADLYGAYRQVGMSPGGDSLRSFYAAHWALVRAKVALIAATDRDAEGSAEQLHRAQQLWSLGEQLRWRAREPLAVVICGPSATGKSVLAAELSRRSEMPVVSSDAVRKRLARVHSNEPARAEHYSAGFTRNTYEQLAADAVSAMQRNDGVIVDATCRSRRDRAMVLSSLPQVAMTRLVVRCEVPLELAVERATRRLHDPRRVSDATPQIAENQFREFDELDELPARSVLRLDTRMTLDAQVAEVASAVDRLLVCRAIGAALGARPGHSRRGRPCVGRRAT